MWFLSCSNCSKFDRQEQHIHMRNMSESNQQKKTLKRVIRDIFIWYPPEYPAEENKYRLLISFINHSTDSAAGSYSSSMYQFWFTHVLAVSFTLQLCNTRSDHFLVFSKFLDQSNITNAYVCKAYLRSAKLLQDKSRQRQSKESTRLIIDDRVREIPDGFKLANKF